MFRRTKARLESSHRALGNTNLGVALAGIGFAIWILHYRAISIFWVLVPLAIIILLAVAHSGILRRLQKCSRIIRFYEQGLARVGDRWMGSGNSGDRFLNPSHPYSRDLDMFGEGSLFELLCTARTQAGEETLAQWLLAPATPDEIRSRQSAISDLRSRLDLRQDLSTLGEDVAGVVRPEALAAWGESRCEGSLGVFRIMAAALAAAWIASLVVWGVWGWWQVTLAISIVNVTFGRRFRARTQEIIGVEWLAADLTVLAGVLARLEREEFSAPKLVALHGALRVAGVSPSRAIGRLSKLIGYAESRRNVIVEAFDLFTFWTLQVAFAMEAWRRKFGPAIRGWLVAVGEMEALSALAGYAYEHPENVFPDFVAEAPLLEAEGLAHPLLPASKAVRNDFSIGGDLRLLMISGSNMAGKSTFVRAVGTNVVLAQCGAPVCARRMRLSPLALAASICILDSLQGGVSHFYAEIARLKQITELAAGELPVLFLLDELLQGTNSHDRSIGAEAVVRALVEQGAIGLITTHDLALARMAEAMGERARNVHFESSMENGKLHFDYRMRPGIVQTGNALHLMRSIGLKV